MLKPKIGDVVVAMIGDSPLICKIHYITQSGQTLMCDVIGGRAKRSYLQYGINITPDYIDEFMTHVWRSQNGIS